LRRGFSGDHMKSLFCIVFSINFMSLFLKSIFAWSELCVKDSQFWVTRFWGQQFCEIYAILFRESQAVDSDCLWRIWLEYAGILILNES
jgi:hypothetical protein